MSVIDFVSLVERDLNQQARKVGSSFFFKCPFHGGGSEKTGSLKVTNGDVTHNPGFYCFGCNEHGGAVGYFLKRGYSLEEAKSKIGGPLPAMQRPQEEPVLPPDSPPGPAWQKRAREFLSYARGQFDTFAQARGSETDFEVINPDTGEKVIERMAPVEWWIRRGLYVLTGEYWGIGYNPKDWYLPGPEFGLPADKKVWIPQGFVIPCEVGSDVWSVKIRRPKGDPKYIHVSGSVPGLYMAENLPAFDTVIFTEGELDALLTWQELENLVGVATLGAATNSMRFNVATWGLYLLHPRYRFSAYDLDKAGRKGAESLARFNFERLEVPRVKPFDKDLTDYYNRTGRLKEWIFSELQRYPGALPEGALA